MSSPAIWISPYGRVYDVGISHVKFVFDNPDKFGLTEEDIRAAYERHGERLGIEGKAREEILLGLLRDGWIRARYNRDGWHIQLNRLNRDTKESIRSWLEIKDGSDKHLPTPLIIMPEFGLMTEATVEDFMMDRVAKKGKKIRYMYPRVR
jgi:hypothetical protein